MGQRDDIQSRLRRLPKIDDVLRLGGVERLLAESPRWAVVEAARREVDGLRQAMLAEGGEGIEPVVDEEALGRRVAALLRPSLRRVLNATGVVIHTNLGRAPLAARAIARVAEVARGYGSLEYRLASRERGSRHEHVADLLRQLTGAEAALVVNNGAGAVLVALAALAHGREVIVSRGELVEIGGAFRVPDVMRASGAALVEVGTTNRTHPGDYRRAIGERTGLLLKVHRSNFAIVGFTAEVGGEELCALGREHGLPVMMDLGSGCLLRSSELGLGREPSVQEVVASGVDVVTFSGDKLLGGPQAGILLLREALAAEVKGHPLMRALRPDKLTLAALEATLELYRDGLVDEVPVVRMLRQAPAELRARAERLASLVRGAAPWLGCEVVETLSAVGGGALPLDEPRSFAVALRHPRLSVDDLDRRLHAAEPPLVGRIVDDRLLLDARTLADGDLEEAARAAAASEEAAPC